MFCPSSTASSPSSGTWTVGEGYGLCESRGWSLPSIGRGKREWPCCCGTVSLWLLSIVLSATKFESPVCEGGLWEADSKIEGWDQSKQTKEGVPKRALRARSTVSTSLASAMAQGIARPTPTASSHEKRRATLQKARWHVSVAEQLGKDRTVFGSSRRILKTVRRY